MFFKKKGDCLILFTAGYNKEGFYPDETNGQLRALATLYKILGDNSIKFVILSGGISHITSEGHFSLAKASEKYIIDNLKNKFSIKERDRISFGGRIFKEITLPNKRIIYFFKEVRSVDTRENIKYSKEVMIDIEKTFNTKILRVYLLSNFFHLERIEILAKQFGIKNYILISAEDILDNIPRKFEEDSLLIYLTKLGFGPLITYIAKKQREN